MHGFALSFSSVYCLAVLCRISISVVQYLYYCCVGSVLFYVVFVIVFCSICKSVLWNLYYFFVELVYLSFL